MIFLQDDESKQQFMVDTSAVCSVLPHRSKATPTGPPLSDADRTAALAPTGSTFPAGGASAAADWHNHLTWVMLGNRASFREDSKFSPAEAVFGSRLILPGQFINTANSPSPSFLNDLQTTMAGRPPPPTWHNSAPAPSTLPEELLLARFVLVRQVWTVHSRRCPRSTTDLTKCWSGQHISFS
jgi:hypothetical protein